MIEGLVLIFLNTFYFIKYLADAFFRLKILTLRQKGQFFEDLDTDINNE
jgi:hypothetical protein